MRSNQARGLGRKPIRAHRTRIPCNGTSLPDELATPDLLALTAEIVAAHVATNSVSQAGLQMQIQNVYSTLASLGDPPAPSPEERPQPAVPVRKSITRDYLIWLEDGRRLKLMKRHLMTAFGLTPEQDGSVGGCRRTIRWRRRRIRRRARRWRRGVASGAGQRRRCATGARPVADHPAGGA